MKIVPPPSFCFSSGISQNIFYVVLNLIIVAVCTAEHILFVSMQSLNWILEFDLISKHRQNYDQRNLKYNLVRKRLKPVLTSLSEFAFQ